jgi:hypothetical protein
MNDLIKKVIIGLGAMVGTFVLFVVIFWFLFSFRAGSAQGEAPAGKETAALAPAPTVRVRGGEGTTRGESIAGGDILATADLQGRNIPLEPKIEGYDWAKWGMNFDEVTQHLKDDGVRDIEIYKPEKPDFTNIVALNPDSKKYKVEYRFYNNSLFYVEVYYSDLYRTTPFSAFFGDLMEVYGNPYDKYTTVDELGQVIFHVRWDTEDSLIEFVSRPRGYFSLSLSSQVTIIKLEVLRRTEEKTAF